MTPSNYILIGLGVAVGLALLLGGTGKRVTRSLRFYYLGDSTLNAGQSANLFLSTSFSVNGVLYQTWLGYQIGVASLWLQVFWCSSFFLLASRLSTLSKLGKNHTLHGAIGDTFSPRALKLAATASIIGFTLQVGWELAVAIGLFESAANLPTSLRWFLTMTLAVVAAGYTILGGLRGNLRANQAQNIVAAFAFSFMMIAVWVVAPGKSTEVEQFGASHQLLLAGLGLGGLISNAVFSLTWQLVDMSAWQNIAATDKHAEMRLSALRQSALWVFIFPGLVGALLGIFLRRQDANLTDQDVIPRALAYLASHPGLLTFVVVGLFCALLSTIDGLLLASAQSFTWDLTDREAVRRILEADEEPPSDSAKQENIVGDTDGEHSALGQSIDQESVESTILAKGRGATALFALAGAAGVAGLLEIGVSLFSIVYVVTIAQMALVPSVLLMLWQRGNYETPAASSIASGLVGGFAWVAIGLFALTDVRLLGSLLLDYAPAVTILAASVPIVFGVIRKP